MISCTSDATSGECPAVIKLLRRFISDDTGATAVEYGLLVALISVAVGGVIANLGNIVLFVYNYILNNVIAASS